MSSQPEKSEAKKTPGWRQPWDPWRIVMFTGAVILLAAAFSRVGDVDRFPRGLTIAIYAVGYGFLAYGFLLAMRTRKAIRQKREADEKEKKVSPPDPG